MSTLIITGPTGAGKNTVSQVLVTHRTKCALIDVDDVRGMYMQPHKAPWDGEEGRAQHKLGAVNACLLANNFASNGLDVIILDVLIAETARIYRELIPQSKIALLMPTYEEACIRFTKRPPTITLEEFKIVYEWQQNFTDYDGKIDNTQLTVQETAEKLSMFM
ncbi:MAG: hypothetical protein RI947_876 [Candidatus Parcubacteria bacterium]|jgi:hypothetical protein